jgi:hypothetical protein
MPTGEPAPVLKESDAAVSDGMIMCNCNAREDNQKEPSFT